MLKRELLLIWSTRLFTKPLQTTIRCWPTQLVNVLNEVFFGASVDQVGPAYFNVYDSSAVGNNIPGSNQQPNGGQFQQPRIQQLPGGQTQDQTLQAAGEQGQALPTAGGKIKPYQRQGARSDDRGATAGTSITKCPCRASY